LGIGPHSSVPWFVPVLRVSFSALTLLVERQKNVLQSSPDFRGPGAAGQLSTLRLPSKLPGEIPCLRHSMTNAISIPHRSSRGLPGSAHGGACGDGYVQSRTRHLMMMMAQTGVVLVKKVSEITTKCMIHFRFIFVYVLFSVLLYIACMCSIVTR